MRNRCVSAAAPLLLSITLTLALSAKENATALAWGYLRAGPVEVRQKPTHRRSGFAHLGRGALVQIWKRETKENTQWVQVRTVDLKTVTPQAGWIEAGLVEEIPLERYPDDAGLVQQLGGPYLDDYAADHTDVTRYLVKRKDTGPSLVCFFDSSIVPAYRLVAFLQDHGKFVAGPTIEFPASEMQAGITDIEARDLFGDGNECLITHEPFRVGPEFRGVNLVIRRIEGKHFKTLWKAPLELRSLNAYPAQLQILQPPERNIGTAGSVTSGEVTFQPQGTGFEPVWKGKVEFFAVGREKAIETVTIEKACPWAGSEFAPLQ